MTAAIALKNEEELAQAVDAIRSIAPSQMFVDLFRINLQLALRIGDLLCLKFSDFENSKGKDSFTIKMQKTEKYLEIDVTEEARALVEERRKRVPNDTYLFESDFHRYKGKPVTVRRVQQVFKEVADNKLDGVKFTTHTMRKSYARILYEMGVPLEKISKMLGHKDTATTLVYLGFVREDIRDIRKSFKIHC